MVRQAGRFRCARSPAVAAVLVAVERALVGGVGSPATLLGALPGHGDAWADPVVPVLALMALVAETLIGYVLVMLVLRWSCALPGALGRVAGRTELLLTPAMTRRALDLLVGGTLLAQATLAATPGPPGGHRPDAPGPAFAVSVTHHVRFGPAVGSEASLAGNGLEPVRHRRPADERAQFPSGSLREAQTPLGSMSKLRASRSRTMMVFLTALLLASASMRSSSSGGIRTLSGGHCEMRCFMDASS
jgi:hypothetical protein